MGDRNNQENQMNKMLWQLQRDVKNKYNFHTLFEIIPRSHGDALKEGGGRGREGTSVQAEKWLVLVYANYSWPSSLTCAGVFPRPPQSQSPREWPCSAPPLPPQPPKGPARSLFSKTYTILQDPAHLLPEIFSVPLLVLPFQWTFLGSNLRN